MTTLPCPLATFRQSHNGFHFYVSTLEWELSNRNTRSTLIFVIRSHFGISNMLYMTHGFRIEGEELEVCLVDLGIMVHGQHKDGYLYSVVKVCSSFLQYGIEIFQSLCLQ